MNFLSWVVYTHVVAVVWAYLHGLALYKSNTATWGKQERNLMKNRINIFIKILFTWCYFSHGRGERFYCVFILFINFITLLTHSTAWWVSQYIAKGVINIIHFQQMEQLRKLQRIIETHPAVWGENSFVILSQASTALTRARATAHFSVLAESQVFLDLYSNFGL